MRKKLFTLLFAIVASVGTMFSEIVQIGNLRYGLDRDNYIAIVVSGNYSGSISIPASVIYKFPNDSVTRTYRVTSITSCAFENCTGLTSVTIPNSVTSIGVRAFSGCSSLTSVTIGNSVTNIGESAFYDCSSLTSVTIPNSVTNIGESAFSGCSSLTSIDIPNSVISIGNGAFSRCTNLTSVTIGNSVTSIGNKTFIDCSSLTSVTIGNSVESIGAYAFFHCHGLTSINFPNSVTSIGDYAFWDCSNLVSVNIPNITYIGKEAFAICVRLDNVTLGGNNLTCIPERAFLECWRLTSITLPNSITNIGNEAFHMCRSLTAISIPNSVTSIGKYAFCDCESLISITIPYGVKIINERTFLGCRSLSSVTIPNSVTSIGSEAFRACNLKSLTLPESVQYIGEYAFAYCGGFLRRIYNNALEPQVINANVFEGVDQTACLLVVPMESFTSYISADVWKDFFITWCIGGYGMCGGTLGWTLNCDSTELFITGIGDMTASLPTEKYKESLQGIFISKRTASISANAFNGCSHVSKIVSKAVTPPVCGENVFGGIDKTIPLHIPAGSTNAYKEADQWKEFFLVEDTAETSEPETYYTIRFMNWDGEVLQSCQVLKDDMPVYTGARPTKQEDELYTYSFSGWSPFIVSATADADYTAQFTATEKSVMQTAPTCADLASAGYNTTDSLVVCLYFDVAPCNDVYFLGNYSGWSTDINKLKRFEPLPGFDGWYVVEIAYMENAQGKPVQLDYTGTVNWDYQNGDEDAWIYKGGNEATIVPGPFNESDISYPVAGCYIYELAYWKNHNNPCDYIPHNYTIRLYAPATCDEYMFPAISGYFNNWQSEPMNESTDEHGKKCYSYNVYSANGDNFIFCDSYYGWNNMIQYWDESSSTWNSISTYTLPAVTKDTTLVFDYSDNTKYRYSMCETREDVLVFLSVPVGAPDVVEIIGSFDDWYGTPMTYNTVSKQWTAQVQAKGSDYFYVKETGTWENEVVVSYDYWNSYYEFSASFSNYWYDGTDDLAGYKVINMDLSDPTKYKWTQPKVIESAIDNTSADSSDTSARKLLHNGQILIFRREKMYTLTGQEVQ